MMWFSAQLLAATLILILGVPLALSAWRFRTAWRALAPRFGSTEHRRLLQSADRLARVYCEAHDEGRTAAAPGFTVEVTSGGFVLQPGLWHRGLSPLWIPWRLVERCEPATRAAGRMIAPCVRVLLADQPWWFLIDFPAGDRLYRLWRSPRIGGAPTTAG